VSEPFIGELRIVSFNFPPRGWARCDGQLLPINQNQALFALLGTTYGGDGQVNFGLPDLRGRMPVHVGGGFVLGQRGGEVAHTLSVAEMPSHRHSASGSTAAATLPSPAGAHWATTSGGSYDPGPPDVALAAGAIGNAGGSQPHENRSPYLCLNIVIALQGIFPSRP
jgi:microcystin-dependent protein